MSKRQSGWFTFEALISLLLIGIITSAVLHWVKLCNQQSRSQIAQIQRLQSGSSLIELMLGLLLSSLGVLAICHVYLVVQQTRLFLLDDLQQQRTAVLFYLAMEPYLENALYIGCDPANLSISPRIQVYSSTDSAVPFKIRQKTLSDVLYLKRVRETFISNHVKQASHFHVGDEVILDSCDHAELSHISAVHDHTLQMADPIHSNMKLHHLENCWIYLADSQFHYYNGKPMHTLFAACDHQPANPMIRGVESWEVKLESHAILINWRSESTFAHHGLNWQTRFPLANA